MQLTIVVSSPHKFNLVEELAKQSSIKPPVSPPAIKPQVADAFSIFPLKPHAIIFVPSITASPIIPPDFCAQTMFQRERHPSTHAASIKLKPIIPPAIDAADISP